MLRLGLAALTAAVAVATPANATADRVSATRAKAMVARLAALGPRPAGSINERRAGRVVTARFRALGYPVTIQRVRLPSGRYSRNIIARLPGALVHAVVVAHLDGVSAGSGANDNASGVAAMLEVAAVLRDRPGVLFAALGAEERVETGSEFHLGSLRLVRTVSREARARIPFAISLDMVGVGTRLYVRGIEASPNRSARLALNRARALGLRVSYLQDSGISDHAEMTRAGLRAAWLQWRPDACWHEACDRARRVWGWKMANAARVTLASARRVLPAA